MSARHRIDIGHVTGSASTPSPRGLRGRYELGEMLGRGGMAEVRIGTDRRLGRTVAIKTLRAELVADPTFQTRFRREARSAAGLNHPSIVAVYDTGEDVLDGISVPYIVMEYVEGRTLREVLGEGRRILPERALEIAADVLDALEYSHQAGIIHRDIKPANVMLMPNGDVKVMDFGIARAVADESARMTQTAAVLGTAQYLSPEQARGGSIDARSDVYSTGCLLYELLTGRPPFVGDSPVSVAYQHVREQPRPPSTLDPEVPPVADAITLKSLQKGPPQRYQSAAEMRDDIRDGLSGQPVIASTLPADATKPADITAALPAAAPPTRPAVGTSNHSSDDEPTGTGHKLAWAMLAIALVIGLGLALMLGLNALPGGNKPTAQILAPTLTGKTLPRARSLLRSKHLRLRHTKHASSDTVKKGVVISQQPAPGQPVRPGSSLDVTVSDGKAPVTIPHLIGHQIAEAKALLESQGLKVAQRADTNSDKDPGTVIGVHPRQGTAVPAGSTVTLTYAKGLIKVPSVVNETETQAEAQLTDAGFNVHKQTLTTTATADGTVIDQTPAAGSQRQRGSTITIVIARQPTKGQHKQPHGRMPADGSPILQGLL